MGTQQILMIVLSVIVVGAAVAVGIDMFDTQADNQARNALAAQLMQHGVQGQAYWRTPEYMGGGNYGKKVDGTDRDDITALTVAKYIDRSAEADGDDAVWSDAVGRYTLSYDEATGIITIEAVHQRPGIEATGEINLAQGYSGIEIILN